MYGLESVYGLQDLALARRPQFHHLLTQLPRLLEGPLWQRDPGKRVKGPLSSIAAHPLELIQSPNEKLSTPLEGPKDF